MSHDTKRSSSVFRGTPIIISSRKRKLSENCEESSKLIKKETSDMNEAQSTSYSPLGDVTSSLNVDNKLSHRAITPDTVPDEWYKYKGLTCYPTPQTKQNIPLPSLSWADREQVWEVMCQKDKEFSKHPSFLERHPALAPKMRAILLDWLTEVSEVYKMHRETYYLAAEYFDRYLSNTYDMPKSQLQLSGITCLFIASKVEEIYPPKLSDFSYVTDGACTDQDILDKEVAILTVLDWKITPLTMNCWLNTYLELMHELLNKKEKVSQENVEPTPPMKNNEECMFPHYSGLTFVQVARLLDMCVLDIQSLQFSPSMTAATALSYITNQALASVVSSYSISDMEKCYKWMAPFAEAVEKMSPVIIKHDPAIPTDDMHNIQTHSITLDNLDEVISKREIATKTENIPEQPKVVKTEEKPLSCDDESVDILTPPKDQRSEQSNSSHELVYSSEDSKDGSPKSIS